MADNEKPQAGTGAAVPEYEGFMFRGRFPEAWDEYQPQGDEFWGTERGVTFQSKGYTKGDAEYGQLVECDDPATIAYLKETRGQVVTVACRPLAKVSKKSGKAFVVWRLRRMA